MALSINANGWSANTAEAVESVIRDIHQDSRGAKRVGVVFVQETKHTGEATGKRAGRLGSRLHSLQGFTVLAHKARTIAVTAGVWPGGGGVAIFVHHLLRQRVQLVQTNPTPPFEATLTVRVRTGPTHWQFITNTYFEFSRPGVVIDRRSVLDDHIRMRARFVKTGKWFLVGDLNMQPESDEMHLWKQELGMNRLDTGPVHSHVQLSSGKEKTLDHVLASRYGRRGDKPLIDDAEILKHHVHSDHRMAKIGLNINCDGHSHRIPTRLVSRINDLEAADAKAYATAIASGATALIHDTERTNERSQISLDHMWDQVVAYINKHLLAKVGNKKVGGFASTDGLARPWMKDKAFRDASAKAHTAFKSRQQQKHTSINAKSHGKRASKKELKALQRLAKAAKYKAKRNYLSGIIKKIKKLFASGLPKDMSEAERLLRILAEQTRKPTAPLPAVYTVPTATVHDTSSDNPSSPLPAPPALKSLTSSETETAEEFSKRLAQFGALPTLRPNDPKAVLGAELDDEHAAWCPPPTESSPLPQADTSSATWTRI